MSITVTYYRLDRDERERVLQDQFAWQQFRKKIQDAYFRSWKAALASLPAQPADGKNALDAFGELTSLLQQSRDPRRFDMEKDWHTIGYLLTGQSEILEEHREGDALHNLIFGGLTTSATTGYGPVRYYDERLVAQSAEALQGVDRRLVAQRFDPARMADLKIYAPPDNSERDAVLNVLDQFTAFFSAATQAKEDVIRFAS